MSSLLGMELAKEIHRDRLAQAEGRRTAHRVRTAVLEAGPTSQELRSERPSSRSGGTSDGTLRADGLHCVTGVSLGSVVLDCPDPSELAEFYRGVLGGEVRSTRPEWVDLVVDGPR